MPYKVKGNCVYKKDTGAKVGCTKGSVQKYLGALYANANESIEQNKLKGGKADKIRSLSALYDYWVKKGYDNGGVSKSLKKELEHEIALGKKIESEHTKDPEKILEIVFDHLVEEKDYYTKSKPKNWAEKEIKKELNENKTIIKRLIKEHINNPKKRRVLYESELNGKTIINVDIQPEYQNAFTFNVNEWVNFLNQSNDNNRIIFLFNGEDTLGMINIYDYQMWLIDLGIDENVVESAKFYDKGYAFFRYCIDSYIDEEKIVEIVKYMYNNQINDSRDMTEELWDDFISKTNISMDDVKELLQDNGDMINIPDLMDFLQHFNNIVLTGGGVNECLKEVEIALLAMNKPFNTLHEFTY